MIQGADGDTTSTLLVWLPLAGTVVGGLIASITAYVTTRVNNRQAAKLESERYLRDSRQGKNQRIREAAGEFIQIALSVDAHELVLAEVYGLPAVSDQLQKALSEHSESDDPDSEPARLKLKQAVELSAENLANQKSILLAHADKRRELMASYTRLEMIGPDDLVSDAGGDLMQASLRMLGVSVTAEVRATQTAAVLKTWKKLLEELRKL